MSATSDVNDLPFDPDALREKYRIERDKRLRPDGIDQYQALTGEFAKFLDDPHVDEIVARDPIEEELDVVVIGGGFSGLSAGAQLKKGPGSTTSGFWRPAGISEAPGTGTSIPGSSATSSPTSTCRCSRSSGTCRSSSTATAPRSSSMPATSLVTSISTSARSSRPASRASTGTPR